MLYYITELIHGANTSNPGHFYISGLRIMDADFLYFFLIIAFHITSGGGLFFYFIFLAFAQNVSIRKLFVRDRCYKA